MNRKGRLHRVILKYRHRSWMDSRLEYTLLISLSIINFNLCTILYNVSSISRKDLNSAKWFRYPCVSRLNHRYYLKCRASEKKAIIVWSDHSIKHRSNLCNWSRVQHACHTWTRWFLDRDKCIRYNWPISSETFEQSATRRNTYTHSVSHSTTTFFYNIFIPLIL